MRARLTRLALSLRYRIRVSGLDDIAAKGHRGVLFLPNHPALIDPVMLMTELYDQFRPRALGDRDQIDRFFVRSVARHLRVIEMPDLLRTGPHVRREIDEAIEACGEALASGDNLVLYPAGHLQSSRLETIGGASAVATIVDRVPKCRIVLVRISGLWGSRFSWARGRHPEVSPVLLRGATAALASLIFFMPRHRVELEFFEASDFPRAARRDVQNRYLENFYNQRPQRPSEVPLTPWLGRKPLPLPEFKTDVSEWSTETVSDDIRETVFEHLRQLSGTETIDDQNRLADELCMDSLQRAELMLWLEDEFGSPRSDIDAVVSVEHVLHAASGHAFQSSDSADLNPVPSQWFKARTDTYPPRFSDGDDIVSAFLETAESAPNFPILADQTAGVRTYRQLLTGIAALQPTLTSIPSTRVGLMLPATVGADVVYLALLFNGKTPVMVNWTVGTRNVEHGLAAVDCHKILTARALVSRLRDQGVDLETLTGRFIYLEDIIGGLNLRAKVRAAWTARFKPGSIPRKRSENIAVILFTSGSESLPKAVPLSDANLLANLRDIFSMVTFKAGDRLLSVLPPFHSFGLTAGVLMPLLGRIPTVHYPVPTDGAMLARHIETYAANLMGGTPTFLAAMVRCAEPGQLQRLRLAVTGGEHFPEQARAALSTACPSGIVLEGYGITECSPIVSINSPGGERAGTVGRPLPSLHHRIVIPEGDEPVAPGERGELLVSGPTVFAGYLGKPQVSPFVELEGRSWYRTGDLVREDRDGYLIFEGRLKRFIKLGGEMISLPSIEQVLSEAYSNEDEEIEFAVVATEDVYNPEVVLFTTREISRNEINRAIRAGGLSPLHSVRRIEHLQSIPVLGTGKTDYRSLNEMLSQPALFTSLRGESLET